MISIVVPTLDEERALPATIEAIFAQTCGFEVIVVDGGSTDGTRTVTKNLSARDSRVRLLETHRGRAQQMNAGAAAATGEWLLFLHADTLLPADALSRISNLPDSVHAGCFRHRFSGPGRILSMLSWFHNRRFQVTRVVYGDQGLFIRPELFDQLGRFPVRTMEDIAFGLRLRKAARPFMLPATAVTDSRKFEQMGAWNATAHAVSLLVRFRFRADVDHDSFFDDYR